MMDSKISKLISYWLRHQPEDGGIELDQYGWASINDVLVALKRNNVDMNKAGLVSLSESFDKVRWKIDLTGNKIKATHGHSISICQELVSTIPPQVLYHGTSVKNLEAILEVGLKSMQRQYVHLSEDMYLAKEVGQRYGKPVIIEIDTPKLIDKGWEFYKTEENVWLTRDIPASNLSFEPWDFDIDQDTKETVLKELKKEIGLTHSLSNKTNKLELVARHGSNDDCLFKNLKNSEYYVVHLTWSGKKEKDGWPRIEIYQSFKEWVNKRLIFDQEDWYN